MSSAEELSPKTLEDVISEHADIHDGDDQPTISYADIDISFRVSFKLSESEKQHILKSDKFINNDAEAIAELERVVLCNIKKKDSCSNASSGRDYFHLYRIH